MDFDGDGKTDISIFGIDDGEWWHLRSSDGGNGAVQFGIGGGDIPVPADYTGDGKTDAAFRRNSTGEWFVLRSEDNSFYSFPFGLISDVPTPGDYDGDGKADPAVYRRSTGMWYILKSSNGEVQQIQFGGNEADLALAADYDGDGRDDIAIYRHSTGEWWLNQSTAGVAVYHFEVDPENFVAFVVADYTGDGKADPAFVQSVPSPGTGYEWFVLRSENQSYYSYPYGISNDIPAVGDFDGDGKADAAVFRPGNARWYINQSTDGYIEIPFGTNQDYPLPGIRYIVY